MAVTKKHIDFHVTRMPRDGRWFGLRLVSSREGSIGIGVAEIGYSLGAYTPPLQSDRVEPYFSSVD